jgi:hypothetical protein
VLSVPPKKIIPKKKPINPKTGKHPGGRPCAKKEKTNYPKETGRPSKKNTLDFEMIETFYGFGLIDEQICKALDITEKTLANWKKDEAFLQAIKRGKAISDNRVERSLYDRAMGYSHLEDDIKVVDKEIVITPTVKHYPPDTTAIIFWLKNRKRAEWRDKHDFEHDITGNLADILRQHLAGGPK